MYVAKLAYKKHEEREALHVQNDTEIHKKLEGRFPVRFTVLPDPYVYLMHHFYSGQSGNLISAEPFQLPTLNLWLCIGSRESACALQCLCLHKTAKQQPALPNGA